MDYTIFVATALTACGIETIIINKNATPIKKLQQHLPLAVLKLRHLTSTVPEFLTVATALTACGIETCEHHVEPYYYSRRLVATALTTCGIETNF